MKNSKEDKLTNFSAAMYISDKFGNNVTDEKLKEVAKAMNYRPNVLIKNYKSIVAIKELFKSNKPGEGQKQLQDGKM